MMHPSPLESTLGQDEIISKALEVLTQNDTNVVVIEGPSGSGKTWTASRIATQIPNKTSLFATGDLVRISELFGPFERLTESQSRLESMAVDGARVAASIGSSLVGFGALGSKVFDWIVAASSTLNATQMQVLSELEWQWVGRIRRLSKGKSVVLVADNVHWWDEASLILLEKISDKQHWADNALISELKFIVVRTVDASQKDYTSERVNRWIQKTNASVFSLSKCSLSEFEVALSEFGASTTLPTPLLEKLYSISFGNLKLAQLIAGAISNGLTIEDLASDANSIGLLRTLLAERFKARDETVEEIFLTLKSAALIGMYFFKTEAACLSSTESNESQVLGNLQRAQDSGLIEISGERVSFSHPVILDFVKQELSVNEIRNLSGKLASCLRLLRPAGYGRQAALFIASGEHRKATEAIALEYLKIKRRNENPEDSLNFDLLALLKKSNIWEFCEGMKAAYDSMALGDYTSAHEKLLTIPEPIERGLALELIYALSLCKMEGGRQEVASVVAQEMSTYLGIEENDDFPEITTRIRLLQQQALVLAGTVNEARKNSIFLMSYLRKRAEIDVDAEMKFHQILRKSNSIHDPFTAKAHLLQAINFFKPKPGQELPEYPLEYYRSLVNLSGVEIQLGNWSDACKCAQSAFDLVAKNQSMKFPRLDVALNNLNVARYRAGLDAIHTSVTQQEIAASYGELINDNFQHRSNLSGMLTLAKEYDRAEKLLTELETEFLDRQLSELYIAFHLTSRRHVLCYLTGDWTAAGKQYRKLQAIMKKIDWPSKSALALRMKLFAQFMKKKKILEPAIFDSFFVEADPQGSGASWPHFGRGIQLSELQFWSDS